MEDLSGINKVIQDILVDGAGDEETFTELIKKQLSSNHSDVRRVALEVLHDVVTDGSQEELLARRALMVQSFIFRNTVLTYVPLLQPLMHEAPGLARDLVRICLDHCSPKEGILALNEACGFILERAESVDVSDMGHSEEGSDDGRIAQEEADVDLQDLANEYIVLLEGYAADLNSCDRAGNDPLMNLVLARMPVSKSTPTLLMLSDAQAPVLSRLAAETSSPDSESVLTTMNNLVESAWTWVGKSTDTGGEQRAILTQLLYRTIALYGQRADRLTWLHQWFLSHHPKYAHLYSTSSSTSTAQGTSEASPFTLITRTLHTLNIYISDLASALSSQTPSNGRFSPFTPLAAMILVAYHLSKVGPIRPASFSPVGDVIGLPPLAEVMPLLAAGLGGSGVDAGGVLLWELISRSERGSIELNLATPLIEILMPLTAGHPDPLSRLAFLTLMTEIISKTAPGLDQIMLLQQILEPANPYDNLRPQGLSILRDLLHSASVIQTASTSNASSSTSATSSSSNTAIYQPALFTQLPLFPSSTHLGLPIEDFISGPEGTFVTDQLITLRVLYELDRRDVTGVRSRDKIEESHAALRSVRGRIDELRKVLDGNASMGEGRGFGGLSEDTAAVEFLFMRMDEACGRLEQTITLQLDRGR